MEDGEEIPSIVVKFNEIFTEALFEGAVKGSQN